MTRLTLSGRRGLAATLVLAAVTTAACTGSKSASEGTAGAHAATSGASSGSAAKSASGSRGPTSTVNPLTGIGPVPTTPLIAVKIDDTAPGRPQVGIDKADIVYIEAVEAGYTRLAALFGTRKPMVGYVRSTRPSDPELLIQYGRITEAFSGGQKVARDIAVKTGLHTWNLGAGKPYFDRVSRASDYINVRLNLAGVAKRVKTPRPRSNGWRFAARLTGVPSARGTRVRTTVTGVYPLSTGTPVEFRYSRSLRKYVRYIGGVAQRAADGQLVTATNVVVLSCAVRSFPRDRDVNGYPAQFTTTTGRGAASVFRQGRRINGIWSRPHLVSGTSLRTSRGTALPLAPGNTWVVLIRKGVAVTG